MNVLLHHKASRRGAGAGGGGLRRALVLSATSHSHHHDEDANTTRGGGGGMTRMEYHAQAQKGQGRICMHNQMTDEEDAPHSTTNKEKEECLLHATAAATSSYS